MLRGVYMNKILLALVIVMLFIAGGTSYYAYSVFTEDNRKIVNNQIDSIQENEYTTEEIEKLSRIEKQLLEEYENGNYKIFIQHFKNSFVATANYIEPSDSILKLYNDGVYAYYNELNEFEKDIFRLVHEESLTQETMKFVKSKFENDINMYYSEKNLIETSSKKRQEEIRVQIDKEKRAKEGVQIGMTTEEVLMSNWGSPKDINKTTTAYGTSEQWVYRNNNYLYFEDGILVSIQN